MILYPMHLVPGAAHTDEDFPGAQEILTRTVLAVTGVEHVRVRRDDDSIRATAFLASPDMITALPIINALRTKVADELSDWHLVPDRNFR